MKNQNKKKQYFWVILLICCLCASGQIHAKDEVCDFWGKAKIRGQFVDDTDNITTYDQSGNPLSTDVYYIDDNGNYACHVEGDPAVLDNTPISFKINGENAVVTGGTNIWVQKQSFECNIEVPDLPPVSDPNGPYSGQEGSSINFDGSGSQNAVTYDWDFGDGHTGIGVTPSHTYDDDDTYTVSLTVTNGSSITDTKTTTATISNVPPQNVDAGNNQQGNEGSSFSFSGSATDPGNDVLTYHWDFDDGGSANGKNVNHTFTNNNIYDVTLTVNDGDGGSGTDHVTVTVNNVPPQNVDAGNNQTVDEGQTVNFSGSATDPGDDVLTYTWDFDDGSNGNGQNTTHVYGDNGNYNVLLTVDDGDDTGTDQVVITVNNVSPTANAGGPYNGIINKSIQLDGTGSSDPGSDDVLTYTWDLDNDGQYDDATGPTPTTSYGSEGTYNISLKVTDDDGGEDTDGTVVQVSQGVSITFETSPSGKRIKIENNTYTAPITLKFPPGDQVGVEAISPQDQVADSRLVYDRWSDSGSRIHNIQIPSTPTTYTAFFRRQYWVEIDDGGKGANPVGEGWQYKDSRVSIAVDSEVFDGSSTKYVFHEWIGTGSGSYSGPNNPAEITINEPITETATWKKYYKLSTSENPDDGGDISPPPPGAWYLSGNVANVSATVATGYDWIGWSGDLSGTTNPDNITMNGPKSVTANFEKKKQVTVTTSPQGLEFFVDGISYTQPQSFTWAKNSVHTLSVDSIQAGGGSGARCVYLNWSDGGARTHEYVVLNETETVTAYFQTQYYVDLESDSNRGNPLGEGWYNEGSQVTFSIDSLVSKGLGSRYRFKGWTGFGVGSYTGDHTSWTVTIQGPIEEIAGWDLQYYLTLSCNPSNSGTITPINVPGGWWNEDQPLDLYGIGEADSGYGFSHWTGDIQSSENPLRLNLSGPLSLTANFQKGHVVINSEPPGLALLVDNIEVITPIVFNWLFGEAHQLGVITPQGDGISVRYEFDQWSDGGTEVHTIVVPQDMVMYTALFHTSYFLNVESEYGTVTVSPQSAGWYRKESIATISVDSVVETGNGIRQLCQGWVGTGVGSYTGPEREFEVQFGGPISEQAQWSPQYQLVVNTFPSYAPGARIEIDPPGNWYNPGEKVSLEVIIFDPQYTFLGWSGSVDDTSKTITVDMDSPITLTANFYTPNLPPKVENFPDTSIFEDGSLQLSFAWLERFVSDPNDPVQFLDFQFEGGNHFIWEFDTSAQELVLIPEPDWNGLENFILKVTDPSGVSDQDTFSIKVISVPDPPEPFKLISPSQDTILTEPDKPKTFIWRSSHDVDPGDVVSYKFYISPSASLTGEGTFHVSAILDTELVVLPPQNDIFYWGVRAEDNQGHRVWSDTIYCFYLKSEIEKLSEKIPNDYDLRQNYPNPFNPETTIPFEIPKKGYVEISVFDIQGQLVCNLIKEEKGPGVYQIKWSGLNQHNLHVASGLYFIRMKAGWFTKQRKIIFIR